MYDILTLGAILFAGLVAAIAEWRAAPWLRAPGRAALTVVSLVGIVLLFLVKSVAARTAHIDALAYASLAFGTVAFVFARVPQASRKRELPLTGGIALACSLALAAVNVGLTSYFAH
ncbi:MAG: hypothetical protein ACYDCK_03785 [Thermoplasmatota archaeon]